MAKVLEGSKAARLAIGVGARGQGVGASSQGCFKWAVAAAALDKDLYGATEMRKDRLVVLVLDWVTLEGLVGVEVEVVPQQLQQRMQMNATF